MTTWAISSWLRERNPDLPATLTGRLAAQDDKRIKVADERGFEVWLPRSQVREVNGKAPEQEALPPLPELRLEKYALPMPVAGRWAHQAEALGFIWSLPGWGLFIGMGGGKSAVTIDYLERTHPCNRVFIVAPNSVVNDSTWMTEFQKFGNGRFDIIEVSGKVSLAHRFDRMKLLIAISNGRPCVIVINYEAIWRPPFRGWFLKQAWDVGIADEGHKLKDPGGTLSRFMALLRVRVRRRGALSGTPLPNSPLDAYGIYRWLDTRIFGTSFTRFKAQYAVMDQVHPSKVDAWLNQGDFSTRFKSIAYCLLDEEAEARLDLPEYQDIVRTYEMDGAAAKAYRAVWKEFCAQVKDGTVTPANAGVRILRLQQLTSGYVGTDQGEEVKVGAHKAELLREVLDMLAPDEPVVIYYRFTHDADRIHAVCNEMGRATAELSGRENELDKWTGRVATLGDSMRLRQEMWAAHVLKVPPPLPPILVVQIQAGSEGLNTLTRARYCVFYSIGYSRKDYDQARGRIRRPGQKHQCTFVHLVAKLDGGETADGRVYRALQAKKNVIKEMLAAADGEQ